MRTSGNRLKFSVQLVRTRDGTVIWSETYDRELKDIFEIQEDVAAAVVDALKLRLLAGNAVSADRRTANVQAYEEYLLGRQYRDGVSLERHQHAQAAFQRAVTARPVVCTRPRRYRARGRGYRLDDDEGGPYDLALAEAERAMALAPRLVEAYVARAHVRMDRNWDYVGAKSDLDFASGIDPNNMELLQVYAVFCGSPGTLEGARNPASQRGPQSPGQQGLGLAGRDAHDARDYPARGRHSSAPSSCLPIPIIA